MYRILIIAAGGAIGAVLRYGMSGMAYRVFSPAFPWGTLVVNLLGSLLIGILWATTERFPLGPDLKSFLLIGLLGAFTTFSTWSLETMHLIREGDYLFALLNVGLSILLGLLLVFTGYLGTRILFRLLNTWL